MTAADENNEPTVARADRYSVKVGDVTVTATPDQERRLREMTAEQRANFARIMGGKR